MLHRIAFPVVSEWYQSHFRIRVTNREGILAEVAGKIQDFEVDIVSVLSDPDRRSGKRTMVFQLVTVDPSSVIQGLKMAGYEVSWIS